jgi:protein-disulfide isomerase
MHPPASARRSLSALALLTLSLQVAAEDSSTVARIGERAISMEELDESGGRAVYDAREQLYEARVRALYQLLSHELLEREAASRALTQQQLIDQEVTPRVSPASEAEIDAFLQTQGAKAPNDGRGRRQAQMYLGMKRQADAKRSYISQLFAAYKVQIALTAPPSPPAETVLGATEPVLGKADAPVTVIAFSDYRCPYCRDLSRTLDQLIDRYPQEVRVVYRHFPLQGDSEALAEGALCAGDQGHFAVYHRALFERNAGAKDVESIGAALNLDLAALKTCISAGTHQERIAADRREGQRLGITGTPTVFVAGQRLRGAQSLQRLSTAVQEALASADPKVTR